METYYMETLLPISVGYFTKNMGIHQTRDLCVAIFRYISIYGTIVLDLLPYMESVTIYGYISIYRVTIYRYISIYGYHKSRVWCVPIFGYISIYPYISIYRCTYIHIWNYIGWSLPIYGTISKYGCIPMFFVKSPTE